MHVLSYFKPNCQCDSMDLYEAMDNVCQELKLEYVLKYQQREIIKAICEGRHVLGLLPTGFGKSDCFALLPLVLNKVYPTKRHMCLIVSPLRSLMMDIRNRYSALGISTAAILTMAEMDNEEINGLKNNEFTLVLTSPEAILNEPWWSLLKVWKDDMCCIAVDEVHCLTTWGSEFRPEYSRVAEIRTQCPTSPILCLTATATQSMVKEIITALHLDEKEVQLVAVLPNRSNIYLDIQKARIDMAEMYWMVESIKEFGNIAPKSIVYARTIDQTIKIYGMFMKKLGKHAWKDDEMASKVCRVAMFHASTDKEAQKQILHRFTTSSVIKVVVATVAFGMGVQVADVRNVVHWGPSQSILGYWQEVGRCARDGEPGKAILYLPPLGSNSHNSHESEKMKTFIKNLRSSQSCIRRSILAHLFVEGMSKEDLDSCPSYHSSCCSHCDI